MLIARKTKRAKFVHRIIACSVAAIFSLAQASPLAYAQFTGGSFGGDEESSLEGGLYTGGSQQGSSNGSSAAKSLAHGDATHLAFTQIPSADSPHLPFRRQPIVEIRDASNNLVSSDNSTQVTLDIFDNPGAADEIIGTTTVTATNGVATYTGLNIKKTAEMYTLIATAPGLTSAISEPFDVLE